jgi:hypothetical protein
MIEKRFSPRQYHTKVKKSREAKLSKKIAVDDKKTYPIESIALRSY